MAKAQAPLRAILDLLSYPIDRWVGHSAADPVSKFNIYRYISNRKLKLLSFIFIIPAIAQDLLNSGSIVIDAASILQPTSTSVMLKISSHVYVPGPFTVKTDPLQLQIFVPQTGSDYPMATLNMPANSIHKNTSMNMDGSQFTPFENYTSWQGFVHNTIFLDDGGLGLKGHVGTQLGQIKKFNLDINKVAPSKGTSFP
jgi:hypothetical protein